MKSDGVIFTYVLDGKGSYNHAKWDDIKKYSNLPDKSVWIHCDYEKRSLQEWLFKESGIPEIYCNSLIVDDARPRVEVTKEGILLILRGINCNPGSDPEDMVSIRMWIEKNRIITLRHRKVKAIDEIITNLESEKGPLDVEDLFVNIITLMTNRTGEIISDLEDEVDEVEGLLVASDMKGLRQKNSEIRRKIISLRRYIFPQKNVLIKLSQTIQSYYSEYTIQSIKEGSENTSKFVDDLDSMRSLAAITSEELNGRVSENMNKIMYILSLITTIFLPLGFLTGLFGINIGGMPGVDNNNAFAIFSVILLVVAIVELILFKLKKWM